jgi:hypothetical protein
MDKFKIGNRVQCVVPDPDGLAGYFGRRGTVTIRRAWVRCFTARKFKFCYGVLFDGDPYDMFAQEWELLPDAEPTPDVVKERDKLPEPSFARLGSFASR